MQSLDELALRICDKRQDLYAQDVFAGIDVVFEHISGSLALGQRVELRDFGTFYVRARRPYSGHAGVGRVKYTVPARFHAAFRAMRQRLNPDATGASYAFLGKAPGERQKPGPKPKARPRRTVHQEILAQSKAKW
jgi:integration host factor subunit beta